MHSEHNTQADRKNMLRKDIKLASKRRYKACTIEFTQSQREAVLLEQKTKYQNC